MLAHQQRYVYLGWMTQLAVILCNVIPTPKVYERAHMFALGVRIRSKILQPFGSGTDLLTDMQNYIKELEEVTKGVNQENAESLNVFHRLMNQGGPQHILLRPVDTRSLANFYKWDEYNVKLFQEIFEETIHHWNDLRVMGGLVTRKDKGNTSPSSDSQF